jgi:hypothetical protein
VRSFGGFSAKPEFTGKHDDGVTSVDDTGSALVATDRTARELVVLDASSGSRLSTVKLAHGPDYVRFVAPTSELWVTEPDAETIEIIAMPRGPGEQPAHVAALTISGGPESLVVDAARGVAFTHLWKGKTVAISLKTRAIVSTWTNGCERSRGLDVDAARDFLFVSCGEGKVVVLDAKSGRILDLTSAGEGLDVIAYDAAHARLHVAAGKSATWTALSVSSEGKLAVVATKPTAAGSHCVTVDARGDAWVCDPQQGRLLIMRP